MGSKFLKSLDEFASRRPILASFLILIAVTSIIDAARGHRDA